MKDKPNEWVSIADLMAGVMAVVMLLLVVSVLQRNYSELKHRQELEQGVAAQKKAAEKVMTEMRQTFSSMGLSNLVEFDLAMHRLTLKDNVFTRGSACITANARPAFEKVQVHISEYFSRVKDAQIIIEGHTDNLPVHRPVTDYERFCTVYDDNYTLSAARAREARKLLIGALDSQHARSLIVAGYGDSQPLKNVSASDGRNRRVEVRFAYLGK